MVHVQFAAIEQPVNTTGQFLATGAKVFFEEPFEKVSATIVDSSAVAKSIKTSATHADIADTRNASELE